MRKMQEVSDNIFLYMNDGEMVCDKCEGRGVTYTKPLRTSIANICSKCQGDGIVDWISNITGKPERIATASSSSWSAGPGRP